jgi:hypothetical protein
MNWRISFQSDPAALVLADRHYSRKSIGSKHCMPPGRQFVLVSGDSMAVWGASWPLAEYSMNAWAGAWVNTLFRREQGPQASVLIREALAATRWYWPDVPSVPWSYNGESGYVAMITFIDRKKVRTKRDPGRCYRKAGFKVIGETKNGLLTLGIEVSDMPEPQEPIGAQRSLTTLESESSTFSTPHRYPKFDTLVECPTDLNA